MRERNAKNTAYGVIQYEYTANGQVKAKNVGYKVLRFLLAEIFTYYFEFDIINRKIIIGVVCNA